MKSVFISSTFRDMQIERDALHARIFPLLNEEADKYYEVFTGIDLRWGIQTSLLSEEEADKKAFLTCFDEIDSSRPYFIAFIGDRYGTSVDESSMSRIFDLVLNKNKMTKEEADEFIKKTSITQKEIEYATFISKIPPSNCFFFFRKGYGKTLDKKEEEFWKESDEKSIEKLEKLKKAIRAKYPNSFYEYSLNYEEKQGFFLPEVEIKHIAECLCKSFLKDYKKKRCSPHEALKQQMAFFSKEREFGFFGREKDYAALEKFLKDTENNILILNGQSGLGKTSLLSHLIESEKNNYEFLPVFVGTTPAFMNEKGVLKYIDEALTEIKGLDPEKASDLRIEDEASYRNVTHETIRSLSIKSMLSKPIEKGKKPLIIILDSVNTIHGSPYLESLDFLPFNSLGYGIKIIISTTDDSSLSLFKCVASGLVKYELKPLKKEDIRIISYNVLSKVFHKDSSEKMIENILKKKNSFEPLYLSLLLRRLLLVNRYDFDEIYQDTTSEDARYNYLEKLIQDEADLSEELVTSLFQKVVEFSNAKFLNTAFSYISLSPYGLTVKDLEELIPQFDESDFYIAIRFLNPLFYRDEMGRISLSHERIKLSVQRNNKSTIKDVVENLVKFFKDKGEARFNERVNIIFDNYTTSTSLIQDLLTEQKDEDIDSSIFNHLLTKLVEEFIKGESVLYEYLYKNQHYALLCKLLKRIVNEERLEKYNHKLIGQLCDEIKHEIVEEDLTDKTSLLHSLLSLLLMTLKSKNLYHKDFENTIKLTPYTIFKIEIEAKTFPEMFQLFTICCFKFFGISSYDKQFVNDFIEVNEILGQNCGIYAIYHLTAKELKLLEEPESEDRGIRLQNLLGEANYLKEQKTRSTDLDRFINRVSIINFFEYSRGHTTDAILGLANDIFINADYLPYIETSYEYQKNIAKVLYINAEAANIKFQEKKDKSSYVAYFYSKNAFLLSSYLASCNLDQDMVELTIDSYQLNINLNFKDGLISKSKNLEIVNSLVQDLSSKTTLNNVIRGKHLMIQGYHAIESGNFDDAERLYRSAISYLKEGDNFSETFRAYNELFYSINSKLKQEEKQAQGISQETTTEFWNYIISSFENGLNISYYDCDKLKFAFKDFLYGQNINDLIYEQLKVGCYLAYCSYYHTNVVGFIQDAAKFYPLIIKHFENDAATEDERSKFFNTLKRFDAYTLITISLQITPSEELDKALSNFENIVNDQPFEAFKLLTVVDRTGFYMEQIGNLEGAADTYKLCWDLNRSLIKKYKYCFEFIYENLISIEAFNRAVTKLNKYPDASLCLDYLVNFANLLNITPFRSLKVVKPNMKVQIEQALAVCITQEDYFSILSFVIDSMDNYYSYSENFPDRLEYEKQYLLYSYYRMLYGCLTNNQKHFAKACHDINESFAIMFYKQINNLREIMDEAELAALVISSTIFEIRGPEEMVEAFRRLPELYPEYLESNAVRKLKFKRVV